MTEKDAPPVATCPVCGRRSGATHRPFCSVRCRQVDLGRWLSGGYVIPGEKVPERDDDPEH